MPSRVAIILAGACLLSGCAPRNKTFEPAPETTQAAVCADPYVDIVNRTNKPLDIYAYFGGSPVLLGQVSPSANRLSLIGTPVEREGRPSLYAMADGLRMTTQNRAGIVTLTYRCGKA